MKLLWLILSLLPLGLLAQTFPVDAASGKIYYADEVLVKDGPQTDLYQRAKAWFAGKNKAVVRVDDIANGLLIGHTYSLFSIYDGTQKDTFQLWYTIKIQMEDDRYWYSLSDFQLQSESKAKAAAANALFTNRHFLEAVVFSKNNVNRKEKEKQFIKLLEKAAHQNILMLIKDLQAAML